MSFPERRRGDGEEGDCKGSGRQRQERRHRCTVLGIGRRRFDQRRAVEWVAPRSNSADPVGALVKLLQNPLVIELLAVGATAALAAIAEHRSSKAQGGEASSKAMKAAGKAAAAAIGRRLASEFEEIRSASKAAAQSRGD